MALIDKASLLFVPSVVAQEKAFNILPSGNRAPDSTDQNSGYDQTRADFTFDRGSNAAATRIGSDGLIKKYRENVLTYSNDFSNAAWNLKAGTFTQGVEDPNGGNTAWSWTAQNTDPYIYQQLSVSGVYTLSIYAKGVGSTIGANFQLRNAALTPTFTLTNEWQRFEIYNIPSNTNLGFEFGNPATPNDVVHIYAAQLEVGTIATDYLDSGATTAKAGVLIDLPRINYDANGENGSLLLEPSRQQLLQYSEYYSASSWQNVGCTITENQTTSPEGLNNATLIVGTNSGGTRVQDYLGALTGNHTFSIYIKSTGSATRFNFQTNDIGGATFSVPASGAPTLYAEGTNVGDPFIEDAGNGWYRVGFTFTPTGGAVNNYFQLYPDSAGNSSSIYAFGAMAEAGSYATSYIPNHGESGGVTRAADSCSVTGASDVIGQTEGTLFVDVNISRVVGNEAIGTINSGGYANHVTIQRIGNTIQFVRNSATQSGATIVTSATITAGRYKLAIAYKSGDTACFLNGAQVSTTQTQTFTNATLNAVKIGTDAIGALPISDSVKQATLFNERLTNSELATLTTL